MTQMSQELSAMKAQAKAMWMAGDYAKWSMTLAPGAQAFVDRLRIRPGMRVLDVACGDGNAAIPAARAGAAVIGIDIVTNSLEAGRKRAAAEGIQVQFDEGDAEQLPYADHEFDFVISFFGGTFTPRPGVAATEFTRVCKPGGRLALSTWAPDSFMNSMFKLMGQFNPPAPNRPPPPILWTDKTLLRAHLGNRITDVQITTQTCPFVYPFGVPEVVELFLRYNGPLTQIVDRLSVPMQNALRRDMEDLFSKHNLADTGTTHIDSSYLEIIVTR